MDNELLTQLEENEKAIAKVNQRASKAVSAFQTSLKELQAKNTEMREKLKAGMRDSGTHKFENEVLSITYSPASTRQVLDTARMKVEEPDTYSKFLKTSIVSDSVKIKVKEAK